jgi:hypothetical protein
MVVGVCGWQAQPLHNLYRDEVLLAPAVDNELQRGTLYPHLGMEETLYLLWIFWFLLWIFVVAIVALGSASIIYFPLSFPLSGSDSESEHAYDSEAFN